MLNRRLWILFVAFVLGFAVLATRLATLQLAGADYWRGQVARFLHPQADIESYRGSIVDRKGRVLAQDVASDELAIDYRAIRLDDTWLGKKASERLKAMGEWGHFPDRATRNLRIDQEKAKLANEIDAIPKMLAAILAPGDGITVDAELEQIRQRYAEISERIFAIRQDVWTHNYKKNIAAQGPSSGGSDADTDDSTLDAKYRLIQLTDEISAHTLRADLPPALALYFKQHASEFPGLVVRDMAQYNRREYPFGEATAHIVGTLRSVDPPTLKARPFRKPNLLTGGEEGGDLLGYLPGDNMGETGVERIAEGLLHGARGERLLDLTGQAKGAVEGPAKDARTIDPVPGKRVQLTIDAGLQKDIYEALKDPAKGLLKGQDGEEHFVAMVVMSLDGQLMAVISYPSYDPNTLDATRGALMRDTRRTPLVNRATSATYQPGSTVKPLEAIAGLTEKVITSQEEITCLGHFYPNRTDILKCEGGVGHGPLELVDAIAKSCNVYFCTVGGRLGVDRLSNWYGQFGFGKDTGMELPESKGGLPRADRVDTDANKTDAIFMGIGQGPIDVTPLQMANAYATLLRGGVSIQPRILVDTPMTAVQAVNFSKQDFAVVRQGMEQCVTNGTAKETFKGFKLKVAGKTGTAEKERVMYDKEGNPVDDPTRPLVVGGVAQFKADGTPAYRQLKAMGDDAWFVGYAPADKPQYVVAAIMEWGGFGGARAAPMVKEAFVQLEKHEYLVGTDVP